MNQLGSIQVREGDLLAGKYRIERVLGVGGMGIVVAARHEQLDQPVAIKFIRGDALDNEEAVVRFLREARSAARLKSEHVARVLDVGRLESGAPYMVMEFLEGNDLGEALTRNGPMSPEVAAALMLQVCEAVAEAHAAGIVHRDLKPENLFLTRTVGGTAKMKVLDFGVSKSAAVANDPRAKLTRTRTVLGSPLYMPPEQLRSSRDVDVRGDVWALGVVLFELLTSRSPFEADSLPELCLKVVQEPPLSLATLQPGTPPELVAVVERCLEKDRELRYANAAELALALEAFAPSRMNMSSARALAESIRLAAGIVDVASVGASSALSSIPAAWGTEERREAAPPRPPARSAVVVGLALALVAGVAAFMVLKHPVDPPAAPAAASHVQPPPQPAQVPEVQNAATAPPAAGTSAATEPSQSPPPAEAVTIAPLPPPTLGAAGNAASKGSSNAAAAPAPSLRVARPVAYPPSEAHTSSGPDEEIPSLR